MEKLKKILQIVFMLLTLLVLSIMLHLDGVEEAERIKRQSPVELPFEPATLVVSPERPNVRATDQIIDLVGDKCMTNSYGRCSSEVCDRKFAAIVCVSSGIQAHGGHWGYYDDPNGPWVGIQVDSLDAQTKSLLPEGIEDDPDNIVWIAKQYCQVIWERAS